MRVSAGSPGPLREEAARPWPCLGGLSDLCSPVFAARLDDHTQRFKIHALHFFSGPRAGPRPFLPHASEQASLSRVASPRLQRVRAPTAGASPRLSGAMASVKERKKLFGDRSPAPPKSAPVPPKPPGPKPARCSGVNLSFTPDASRPAPPPASDEPPPAPAWGQAWAMKQQAARASQAVRKPPACGLAEASVSRPVSVSVPTQLPAAPVAPAAPASAWEEHFDTTHQAPYWYNTATGECTWNEPAEPVGKPATASLWQAAVASTTDRPAQIAVQFAAGLIEPSAAVGAAASCSSPSRAATSPGGGRKIASSASRRSSTIGANIDSMLTGAHQRIDPYILRPWECGSKRWPCPLGAHDRLAPPPPPPPPPPPRRLRSLLLTLTVAWRLAAASGARLELCAHGALGSIFLFVFASSLVTSRWKRLPPAPPEAVFAMPEGYEFASDCTLYGSVVKGPDGQIIGKLHKDGKMVVDDEGNVVGDWNGSNGSVVTTALSGRPPPPPKPPWWSPRLWLFVFLGSTFYGILFVPFIFAILQEAASEGRAISPFGSDARRPAAPTSRPAEHSRRACCHARGRALHWSRSSSRARRGRPPSSSSGRSPSTASPSSTWSSPTMCTPCCCSRSCCSCSSSRGSRGGAPDRIPAPFFNRHSHHRRHRRHSILCLHHGDRSRHAPCCALQLHPTAARAVRVA